MRTRVRKFAHVLERTGLAMAGAASGLFVAAHVGSIVFPLASEGFIIVMMLSGAVGSNRAEKLRGIHPPAEILSECSPATGWNGR